MFNLLQKLAVDGEVQGASERKTGAYTPVCEDWSTGATQQFAATVKFRKRSIASRQEPSPRAWLLKDLPTAHGEFVKLCQYKPEKQADLYTLLYFALELLAESYGFSESENDIQSLLHWLRNNWEQQDCESTFVPIFRELTFLWPKIPAVYDISSKLHLVDSMFTCRALAIKHTFFGDIMSLMCQEILGHDYSSGPTAEFESIRLVHFLIAADMPLTLTKDVPVRKVEALLNQLYRARVHIAHLLDPLESKGRGVKLSTEQSGILQEYQETIVKFLIKLAHDIQNTDGFSAEVTDLILQKIGGYLGNTYRSLSCAFLETLFKNQTKLYKVKYGNEDDLQWIIHPHLLYKSSQYSTSSKKEQIGTVHHALVDHLFFCVLRTDPQNRVIPEEQTLLVTEEYFTPLRWLVSLLVERDYIKPITNLNLKPDEVASSTVSELLRRCAIVKGITYFFDLMYAFQDPEIIFYNNRSLDSSLEYVKPNLVQKDHRLRDEDFFKDKAAIQKLHIGLGSLFEGVKKAFNEKNLGSRRIEEFKEINIFSNNWYVNLFKWQVLKALLCGIESLIREEVKNAPGFHQVQNRYEFYDDRQVTFLEILLLPAREYLHQLKTIPMAQKKSFAKHIFESQCRKLWVRNFVWLKIILFLQLDKEKALSNIIHLVENRGCEDELRVDSEWPKLAEYLRVIFYGMKIESEVLNRLLSTEKVIQIVEFPSAHWTAQSLIEFYVNDPLSELKESTQEEKTGMMALLNRIPVELKRIESDRLKAMTKVRQIRLQQWKEHYHILHQPIVSHSALTAIDFINKKKFKLSLDHEYPFTFSLVDWMIVLIKSCGVSTDGLSELLNTWDNLDEKFILQVILLNCVPLEKMMVVSVQQLSLAAEDFVLKMSSNSSWPVTKQEFQQIDHFYQQILYVSRFYNEKSSLTPPKLLDDRYGSCSQISAIIKLVRNVTAFNSASVEPLINFLHNCYVILNIDPLNWEFLSHEAVKYYVKTDVQVSNLDDQLVFLRNLPKILAQPIIFCPEEKKTELPAADAFFPLVLFREIYDLYFSNEDNQVKKFLSTADSLLQDKENLEGITAILCQLLLRLPISNLFIKLQWLEKWIHAAKLQNPVFPSLATAVIEQFVESCQQIIENNLDLNQLQRVLRDGILAFLSEDNQSHLLSNNQKRQLYKLFARYIRLNNLNLNFIKELSNATAVVGFFKNLLPQEHKALSILDSFLPEKKPARNDPMRIKFDLMQELLANVLEQFSPEVRIGLIKIILGELIAPLSSSGFISILESREVYLAAWKRLRRNKFRETPEQCLPIGETVLSKAIETLKNKKLAVNIYHFLGMSMRHCRLDLLEGKALEGKIIKDTRVHVQKKHLDWATPKLTNVTFREAFVFGSGCIAKRFIQFVSQYEIMSIQDASILEKQFVDEKKLIENYGM